MCKKMFARESFDGNSLPRMRIENSLMQSKKFYYKNASSLFLMLNICGFNSFSMKLVDDVSTKVECKLKERSLL